MAINKNDYIDVNGDYDLKKSLVDELIDELTTLEQNIDSVHQQQANNQNINTIFTNMKDFSTTRIYAYSANTSLGHPVTSTVAYWVCTITRMGAAYGQAIFTTTTRAYVGSWYHTDSKFNWKELT